MKTTNQGAAVKVKRGKLSYAKWGYVFILPFFLVFAVFQFYPLIKTFYYSFFTEYKNTQTWELVHEFVGFENFGTMFADAEVWQCLYNTLLIWLMGFIPQIIFSLLLAQWFTDIKLRLKATGVVKAIIYMPNLIMASAFAMLFFTMFSKIGPVHTILENAGIIAHDFDFFQDIWSTRGLIALMNFLMWFGNTTIILMAAIMGVDTSLYESASIDGASSPQQFFKITLPLIKPILVYVLITSLIGGIQMFDVPQVLTQGDGSPAGKTKTLLMLLNKYIASGSGDKGKAGVLSIIIFLISVILSVIVFFTVRGKGDKPKKKKAAKGA